jgi:PST family polysaccharide transporter
VTLIRTSILNSIATAIRILTSVALNKVLAVYVGPTGYALVGQFSNFVAIVSSLGGGAVATGVTKYTAEHYDNVVRKKEIWRLSFRYILFVSLLFSVIIAVFSKNLADTLLGDDQYQSIFILFSIALPLISFNLFLVAIINGQKELTKFVYQNVATSILGALISSILAAWFGLWGALAALSVNQGVILVITLIILRKSQWLTIDVLFGKVNYDLIGPMAGYLVMALTAAITGPISQVFIRNNIIEKFGEASAGEWQAVFKISEIYLTFFTATLSVYYLPRISEIRDNVELKREVLKVYKLALPAATIMAFIIFILRDYITITLFTTDFLGMTQLFAFQLLGDVIKIGSWILGFVMVGRGMVKWFLLTEIIFSCTWIALTFALTNLIGLRGVTAAFAANYILYWTFLIWLMRKKIR